ncbi:MAG TPA: hypothetical protein VF332_11295 [Vicinamibacterales bacterium]
MRTVLLVTTFAATAAMAASESPPPRTGWAGLSGVAPGTAVIVLLNDGRRLERYVVGTTADSLVAVDLSLIASRDRREQVLSLVRESPQRFLSATDVEADGRRVPVVQRFDRASIVTVAKPRPLVFTVPPPLRWMLAYSGPCPNCDAAQTALNGETPLPSALPRRAAADPLMGEVLYRAPMALTPNPLDSQSWEQLKLLLPASLRGK